MNHVIIVGLSVNNEANAACLLARMRVSLRGKCRVVMVTEEAIASPRLTLHVRGWSGRCGAHSLLICSPINSALWRVVSLSLSLSTGLAHLSDVLLQ